MKMRDWLTLAAIVGGLVVMFMITRYSQPERVKPGSPEYVEYIEHYIGECLRSPQAFDRTHSESLSEAEREAACRGGGPSSIAASCAGVIFDMPHSRHDRAAAPPTLIARKFHLRSRPRFDNRRLLRKLCESSTTERR